MTDHFEGLKFVIQYRRRDFGHGWKNMAAFDVEGPATKYLTDLSKDNDGCPWVYRMLELETGKTTELNPSKG